MKPWSAEARQRHLEGCRRYQKYRAELELVHFLRSLAQAIDVDLTSLAKTLTSNGAKVLKLCDVEPREERLKAVRGLVLDTCKDATSYRTWEKKMSRGVQP